MRKTPEYIKQETIAANRYEEMRVLAKNLQMELRRLEDLSYQSEIKNLVFDLLRNRLEGRPVRAFFVRQVYLYVQEAMGKTGKKFLANFERQMQQQLPFVFEVVITIQYLHNQILDGKAGVTSNDQINQNLIAANLLKELLYEYITEYFPPKQAQTISRYVRRSFKYVDFGQFIEKKWNNFEQFNSLDLYLEDKFPPEIEQFIRLEAAQEFVEKLHKELPLEVQDFTNLYLKRIYLTCTALFVLATELIIELTAYRGVERQNLLNFSICYGMMRQLVNDNADFIPAVFNLSTHSKGPADAFSDLKNHNLTLPLIFYLTEHKNTAIHKFLKEGQLQLSPDQESAFFESLQSSFALYKSIQNNKILGELAIGWLNPDLNSTAFLTNSCEIVYWNKFLFPCLKNAQYKAYKKTFYYTRTKALIQKIKLANQPQRKATLSILEMVNHYVLPGFEYPNYYYPKWTRPSTK